QRAGDVGAEQQPEQQRADRGADREDDEDHARPAQRVDHLGIRPPLEQAARMATTPSVPWLRPASRLRGAGSPPRSSATARAGSGTSRGGSPRLPGGSASAPRRRSAPPRSAGSEGGSGMPTAG